MQLESLIQHLSKAWTTFQAFLFYFILFYVMCVCD